MRNDPLCSCQYVVSVLTVSHVWYKLACQGLLVVACVCPQQTLVQARQTVVAQALLFVLCSVVTEAVFLRCRAPGYKILGWSALWCWSGLCLWATARSEINDDLQPQLKRCPSVLHMDRMITVEYEEEARFFPQRLILRIASIAAMFHNSRGWANHRTASSGLSLQTSTCIQRCF